MKKIQTLQIDVITEAVDIHLIQLILGTTKRNTALITQSMMITKKSKAGYLIVWGTAQKVDLKHAFKTNIGVPIDNKLKNKAPKYNKDKFEPIVYAYLSDMTYTANGWTYRNRTRPVKHEEELNDIIADSVDLGDDYLPFLTQMEDENYEKNESLIFWKKEESSWTPDENITLDNGQELEGVSIPMQYEVPDQQITDWN